ncbi:dispersed gene family protein 1 (DGF-1), putative, partial [Trypanosoma cruzi]
MPCASQRGRAASAAVSVCALLTATVTRVCRLRFRTALGHFRSMM